MAIEIVDLPLKKTVIFHRYISLPEGNSTFHWPSLIIAVVDSVGT